MTAQRIPVIGGGIAGMCAANEAMVRQVLAIEDERCRCIVEQRFERLRQLLSPQLVHTHTRGNVDTRDSYLAYVGGVIESLALWREDLRVVPLGADAAVLHGRQTNLARRRGTAEQVRVEAMVTQVFAREADGQWRMVAFQATPLGPAPPAVPRPPAAEPAPTHPPEARPQG